MGGGGLHTCAAGDVFPGPRMKADESKHADLMPLSVVKDAAVLNVLTLLLGVLS